jgi:hypothetical protein
MIDLDLKNNRPAQNNDIYLILQQIDILFGTKPKEVLGFEDFGTNYEKYLYDLNISNESIKYSVLSDLNSLDLMGFNPEVEVYLLQGTEHDIALVTISLTREDEYYQKIYKIN